MSASNHPRPLSTLLPGLTKDVFGRKNMLFGKMLAEWAQIAGAEVAQKTLPLELRFSGVRPGKAPKSKLADGNLRAIPPVSSLSKPKAVLHLAVQPGYALEFSYQKLLLIERLNVFFGYPAISDIKAVQNSEIMDSKKSAGARIRRLDSDEERNIEALVSKIEETDLQIALKNLGKAILSRI